LKVEIVDKYFKNLFEYSDYELLTNSRTLLFLKYVGTEYSGQELLPEFQEVTRLFWNAHENSKEFGSKFSCLSCEGFLQPKDFRVDNEWVYYFLECNCCGNKDFIKLERNNKKDCSHCNPKNPKKEE